MIAWAVLPTARMASELKKPKHLCVPVDKNGEAPGAETRIALNVIGMLDSPTSGWSVEVFVADNGAQASRRRKLGTASASITSADSAKTQKKTLSQPERII